MPIKSSKIVVSTTAGTDIIDISDAVEQCIARFSLSEGLVHLFIPGSTAALTTIEYESGAVGDLKRAIEHLAPEQSAYEHDRKWGDGNGYAHVRAALLGPSLTIPLAGGRMLRGMWQQIVLCDFDNRPRQREVLVQVHAAV